MDKRTPHCTTRATMPIHKRPQLHSFANRNFLVFLKVVSLHTKHTKLNAVSTRLPANVCSFPILHLVEREIVWFVANSIDATE